MSQEGPLPTLWSNFVVCFLDVHERSGRLFSILQHIYCTTIGQFRTIYPIHNVGDLHGSLGAIGTKAEWWPLSDESLER